MKLHSRHTGGNRSLYFDRLVMPSPMDYLSRRRLVDRSSNRPWVSIRCPAHKGGAERNPSLRVNTTDGHFKCMTCGKSGGGILALHMLFTGLGTLDALRDLAERPYG